MAYGGPNYNRQGYSDFTSNGQQFNTFTFHNSQGQLQPAQPALLGRPPWIQEWEYYDQNALAAQGGTWTQQSNNYPQRQSRIQRGNTHRQFQRAFNQPQFSGHRDRQPNQTGQNDQWPSPEQYQNGPAPANNPSEERNVPERTSDNLEDGSRSKRGRNQSRGRGRVKPGMRWSRDGEREPRYEDRKSDFGGSSRTDQFKSTSKEPADNMAGVCPQEKEIKPLKITSKTNDPQFKSQREFLMYHMRAEKLECMVCYDTIKHKNPIWSCSNCYNIFHIWCVQKWSRTVEDSDGWRCPGCNQGFREPPEKSCFCGKTRQQAKDMNLKSYSSKHCCDEICYRNKPKVGIHDCNHPCGELCHPGPCPPCEGMALRKCPCGKKTASVKCTSDSQFLCDSTCDKLLSCGRHNCQLECHVGSCGECLEAIDLECMCGRTKEEVLCKDAPKGDIKNYSCKQACGKDLECGNHKCKEECHSGDCPPCPLLPEINTTCQCGKVSQKALLLTPRESCLDPVPQCPNRCNLPSPCGHNCPEKCHAGQCPVCKLQSQTHCACGSSKKMVLCSVLAFEPVRCNKKCPKWLSCLRHKCHDICCCRESHECLQICNKSLNCGRHRCDQLCHSDRCPPCLLASFDELRCECGTEILYPPIPCGTKPPMCNRPCKRSHPCGHNSHNCHSEPECPPCTVPVKKWCMGKHKEVYPVLCNQEFVSCHLLCSKPLECGQHNCIKKCHAGPCLNEKCTQACTKQRPECGHSCNSPCHGPASCPDSKCMFELKVTCECKTRSEMRPCHQQLEAYKKKVQMDALVENMSDLMKGQKVSLPGAVSNVPLAHWTSVVGLECDHECNIKRRNERAFVGLQIVNPDLGQKLKLEYPISLLNWVAQDKEFVKEVHNILADLVYQTQQGPQRFRLHSFGVMNQMKRKFIHEYAPYFGLQSKSIDKRHSRSVDVTGEKNNCWLPSISLHEMVERKLTHSSSKSSLSEMKKLPGPPTAPQASSPSSSSTVLSYTQALAAKKN
ncbi:protein shuttle craft-like [Neocloeon triangulifer]|uniref:protein shuttle craft-like n=1 Tax=Neocloeon triangulifer TaxID=2078957 RepID=UPI00286F5430|nr:protein shuttle craft-like [Neocloeon triangulifer]